ncbi:hypothetical protein CORC01_07873 [Colletotrichum orchidophilum]|uniref:Enoyl reductase (ER) domain-containing protein n=1 Tax=Colletotrichum orchidophilum TaxID=1209926 RepID=A0A1G4B6F4_9PEZI|nr:uncharacterized protein CORC01_07873 [Colletotrichum orchidophilum]OHE96906.1 hypothetical protein CORC01_07873 [Colletotrichum orchidophilum]
MNISAGLLPAAPNILPVLDHFHTPRQYSPNHILTMATQQVFRLPQRTSTHDLVVGTEPVPEPSSNEVLVRIRSVALNYRDFAVANGKYPFPVKDNVVPGSDLAGDVVKVGSHVDDFVQGDRVVSTFDLSTPYGPMKDWNHSLGGCLDGALQQYIALPSSTLVKVPEEAKLSYSQLSALVCTGTTAWNSLYGNTALKPGQTVLFLGTGGISITGLILAKAAGATTIITSSSDSKLEYVKETYGPDHVINYKTTPNWSQEVLKITKGRGADFIFENGGAGTIAESINAVAYGGSIAVIGFLASCEQSKMPDVAALVLSKGAVVRGIMVGSKQHLEEVMRYVVARELQVPVEKEFASGRDDVIAAFEYLTSGTHIGKVCIRMS